MAVDELTIAMRLRGARQTNSELNETAASVGRLDAATRRANRSAYQFSRGMTRTGKTLTRNVTVPLLAATVASVKFADDFDKSQRRIQGLVGVSAKEMEYLRGRVLALAPTVGIGPTALSDALFFVESAGIHGARAMDVLTMSAKASAAGLGDLSVITDGVTSAMNAYSYAGLSAAQATDTLVAAVRLGKMPADALVSTLGRILPLAASLRVAYGDVLGTMAALSRVGVSPAQAATGVQSFLSGILKPSAGATSQLAKIGLNPAMLRRELQTKGIVATMRTVNDAAGGNLTVLARIFPNIKALRTIFGLLAQDGKTVDHVLHGVKNSTGATGKAFDVASKGPGFRLHQALVSLQVAAIKFGDKIAPVVDKIAHALAVLGNILGKNTTATFILLGLLATVGPLLTFAGGIYKVYRAMLMLRTATFAATVAEWGFTAAVLANPITWLVVALVALGVIVYEIASHFKRFRAIVGSVWGWIKKHVEFVPIFGPGIKMIEELAHHFGTVKKVVMDVVHWIQKAAHWLGKLHMPGGGIVHGILSHIPGFAAGGTMPMSGAALVGEAGPEIVTLPRGAHISSNQSIVDAINSLAQAVMGQPLVVEMDGRVVTKGVARAVADVNARA